MGRVAAERIRNQLGWERSTAELLKAYEVALSA
jgi:hypothetical protein